MPFETSQRGDHSYSNADSFAMAFDEAWKNYSSSNKDKPVNTEEKIELIFQQIQNHPFLKDYPNDAKQVAKFRLRLLNLE